MIGTFGTGTYLLYFFQLKQLFSVNRFLYLFDNTDILLSRLIQSLFHAGNYGKFTPTLQTQNLRH